MGGSHLTREGDTRREALVGEVIGALREAFAGFLANQGFFLAAGLSFFFLICVIPLLFLSVSLAGFILSSEAAARAVVSQLAQNFPVYRAEITRVLLRIVQTRTLSGLLGTGILILFSTQLFTALRLVLNLVLRANPRGGFLRGMLFDVGLVLAIGVLFVGNVAVTELFGWLKLFIMMSTHEPGPWIASMSFVLAVLLSTAMFYMLYRFLPSRRVATGSALTGALLTSLLWEIAKQLFRLYIRKLGLYDQIYGPLGVLVAFVMFVYYTMIVFVLGAAYVAALENRRHG
jgi:membrane protein